MENIRNARELKTYKKPSHHKTRKELDAAKEITEHKYAMVIKAIDHHENHISSTYKTKSNESARDKLALDNIGGMNKYISANVYHHG